MSHVVVVVVIVKSIKLYSCCSISRRHVVIFLKTGKLWVPATAINIAFCPPALRVLFLNCVFFFWSIFLSLKLNKEDETASEA